MLSVVYADCHLCLVSHIRDPSAKCHYAEGRYTECRGTIYFCINALFCFLNQSVLNFLWKYQLHLKPIARKDLPLIGEFQIRLERVTKKEKSLYSFKCTSLIGNWKSKSATRAREKQENKLLKVKTMRDGSSVSSIRLDGSP
jgi:hypothetical protein